MIGGGLGASDPEMIFIINNAQQAGG